MYPNQFCIAAGKPTFSRKTACKHARRKKIQLYYYLCPHCAGWHVTSKMRYKGVDNIKPPRVT